MHGGTVACQQGLRTANSHRAYPLRIVLVAATEASRVAEKDQMWSVTPPMCCRQDEDRCAAEGAKAEYIHLRTPPLHQSPHLPLRARRNSLLACMVPSCKA